MQRIEDINFGVNVYNTASRVVVMRLMIENPTHENYYINGNVMLQEKFIGCNRFTIRGPIDIQCIMDSSNKDVGERISVPGKSTVEYEVVLSDRCDFSRAPRGIYEIIFNTYFDLYSSVEATSTDYYAWQNYATTFVLGGPSEWHMYEDSFLS